MGVKGAEAQREDEALVGAAREEASEDGGAEKRSWCEKTLAFLIWPAIVAKA